MKIRSTTVDNPEFLAHLERASEDIASGSIPRSLEQLQQILYNSEIIFALYDGYRIVAHSELTRNPISPYRVSVSACVERRLWGRRLGPAILGHALSHADNDPTVEYVDGWAWGDNERALRMDYGLGFEIVGTIKDIYRTPEGRSRDQVTLVRKAR